MFKFLSLKLFLLINWSTFFLDSESIFWFLVFDHATGSVNDLHLKIPEFSTLILEVPRDGHVELKGARFFFSLIRRKKLKHKHM